MNAARLDFAPVLQKLLTPFAGHPLLERLFFASVELAALALLVFAAIRVGRIRSPRLTALLWLLVLGKPLVSLAVGSPFHLFRMEVPSAVVAAPAPLAPAVPTDPQPPFAISSSSSADVQSPREPIVMDEEMAAARFEPLPEKATPTPATSPVTSAVAVQAPPTHTPSPWNPAKSILGIWLIGVACFAGLSLLDRARIRRLVRTARKPEPSLADRYTAIAAEMGLKRPAPLRVTDEMEGPALAGSIWSTILIPAWLAEDANEAKLDWALRHELMHYRLRDPWAGLVRELSHMLFYFHPAAWWAGAQWKTATEKACDRAIVADEAAARDYAEQLYRILVGIHGRRQAALRTGLFATRTQIGQRIAALLYGPRTAPHLSAVALVAVALVTAVTLSVGGAFADKNAKRDEPENTPAVAATDKAAEPQPAPISASTTSQPAPAPAPDVTFTYAGTVVDDHGKPVAGAKISLDYVHASYPLGPVPTLAATDDKGRFEFSRRKRDFADGGPWGPWWFRAMLVATKPGYGPGGGRSIEFETSGRLVAEQHHPPGWQPKGWSNVLKLASDDVPIQGRILDTEGRPVSGALVETINLWEGRDGSLDAWEAAALRPGADSWRLRDKLRPINFADGFSTPRATVVPSVRTDPSGSFTLKGLGRERLADLAVSALGIETTLLHVRARRGAIIKVSLNDREPRLGKEIIYPCEFTRVSGPSVPVEGHVTDARSGRPLADVQVNAARIPSSPFTDGLAARLITATTDARGHYRLEGLPLGRARLGVVPPLGSRYLMAGVDVGTRMQRTPLVTDIKLAAGIMVRGRAIDSRKGIPAQGSLEYFAFWTNPHLQEARGFENSGFLGGRAILHYRCDADGRFEIPVLPGRGILAYRADALSEFPRGIGAADIDGPKESGRFTTAPSPCGAEMFHLLKPLNPQPGTESLALDLTVRSPAIVSGTVRGPDGKPLVDYSLSDESSFLEEASQWGRQKGAIADINGATFEIEVYSPKDHHRLMFHQRSRNLAGFREFTGELSGPLDIKLEPAATLKGRVVDDGGQPLGDVSLVIAAREDVAGESRPAASREAGAATGPQLDKSQITTDKDGRFELRRVVPGLAYSAIAQGAITSRAGHRIPRGTVFTNMTAQAGETKELGDLRIASADGKSAAAPPERKNDPKVDVVHGRVLLPDGRPAAGAKVVALRRYFDRSKRPPLARTTTGAVGQFTIRVPKTLPEEGHWDQNQQTRIAAAMDGFGPQWTPWRGPNQKPTDIVLKLVAEMPIQGRIVDLEGKPVRDARVTLLGQKTPRQGLDAWREAAKSGDPTALDRPGQGLELEVYDDAASRSIRTDRDGRFTIHGVGEGRLVRLSIQGETIAWANIDVVSRAGKPFAAKLREGTTEFFGADFTYQAAPTREIFGTVRDLSTGVPLSGVTIAAGPRNWIRTETDAQGKYRLVGLPKGDRHRRPETVDVVPQSDQPYLSWKQYTVPDSPGLEPITLNFRLSRGLWITGRVTDGATGKPVRARVVYLPALGNATAEAIPEFKDESVDFNLPEGVTGQDGVYRLVGLPGRGVLVARTFFGIYGPAERASQISKLVKGTCLSPLLAGSSTMAINALEQINPTPGLQTMTCDLVVRPGGMIRVSVVDPSNKPIDICDYTYVKPGGGPLVAIDHAPFDLRDMVPNESRSVLFMSWQRRLGKVQVVHYAAKSPRAITVRLEPCATVKGRLVDKDGVPVKFGELTPLVDVPKQSGIPLGRGSCDSEGRFVFRVAAGAESYSIYADRLGLVADKIVVAAGQAIDLSDIRPKRDDAPVSTSKSDVAPKPAVAPAKPVLADVNVIRGRVLLPDGRPAGEAKLSMMRFHWKSGDRVTWERLAAATASAGGEFEIRVPSVDTSPEQLSLLVATAPGFGVQCVGYGAREVSHPLEIKLRPDQPVRGRLLDLEGKPVAGARVRVATITDSLHDDLGPWLAAMKAGVQRYSVAAHALLGRFLKGFPADGGSATTDGDGRFTLTGLGAERIVDLAVESERTAYAVITVATRHMEPIIRPSFPNNAGGLEILGDEFTKSLRPTRPVVGVVRDAQTKRPLAGVSVESWHVAGEFFAGQRDVRTSTDAQGRYRLIGLPKGQGNAIFVVPNDEQPYFMRNLDVPDSAGMEAVTVDIELHRGLWITGCVTDKETGQPVLSQINYWPFLDNVFTQGRPEFGPGNTMQGDYARFRTREDGSFRVPGLPGHGLVGAEALSPNYRRGAGAAEIGGFDEDRRLRTFRNQGWPGAKYPTTMKEINPVKGTENVVCNLVCDHGETVRFTVLDPAGQPVNNCALSLPTMTKEGKSRGVDSPFEVNNLSLDTAQPLVIEQKERQLGKFFVFTVKKDSPRSLTVRLEPTMTVAGRLVDQDGVPLSGISVQPMLRRLGDFSPQLPAIVCGSDGRFEYTGLPSGAKVDFQAVGTAIESLQNFGRMEVTPGKRVDLGEIKLKRRNSATPAATTSTAPENPLPAKTKDRVEVNVVHGRVLLPDSKPGAGARVVALRRYWVENVKRTPIAKTTAAPDGAFTMAIPKNTPDDGVGTAAGLAWIAAEVDGYGTNYQNWRRSDPTQKELAIKLLPEVPIHGRIVDLEGKPVAGVRVAVNWQASPRQEFGAWLESLRAGSLAEFEQLAFGTELQGYEDDTKPPVVTDPVGRFTLRGIGADRVIRLALHGDRIADTSIDVIARPIKPFPRQTGGEGTAQVFGADFTFEAAPTRLIVGTVRDGSTGMPLGGVSIRQFRGPVHTETDSQGKYRLVGLPKLKPGRGWESRYEISILPNPDQPYLALKQLDIPYSPGLDPITLDVKLPRGVWVTGRVTDKETGAPAVSAVSYFPALSNPLLKQFPHLTDTARDRRPTSYTGPDGTFRVVCLPGRGLIAVRGTHKIYVVGVEASRFTELAKNYPKDFYRQGFNISAIQEIEPAQGAAKVTCDLVVSAGGTMRVLLADRAGKPVSPSVFFYDMARGGLMNSVTDESPFDLTAFEPNESRPILFHCAKHRIGKSLLIHYDEKSPHSVTVTLEPWATVKGRIVDADGVPRKGGHLSIFASIGNHDWIPAGSSIDCDAGGRFVCDNVAPGADSYSVFADGADGRTKFMAVAGKTIDLGDIKPQRDEATVSTSKPDAAPRPAASPAKPAVAEVDVIHGRVLLPDGKPAAGARVFALRRFFTARGKRSPVAKMTAGPNGEFTLRLPKIQPADDVNAAGGLVIAAEAKGFGAQWRTLSPRLDSSKEELVLKLLPECPIHGRIVDLEGKPVGGVRVVVAWQNKIDGDFESWLKAAKAGDVPFRLRLGRPVLQMPGYDDESQPPVVTDRDGRFTLMGIGTDHLAQFELRGDTIAYAALDAVAHSIQPLTFKGRSSETSQLFGADFTYQAVPTRPIVGFVRDAVTGTPLAGVSIESTSGSGIRTETDVQGRYRLVGLAKARQNVINVVPNQDQPYFARKRVKVPESVGLAAITLDFNLTRGTWITGRVTDKATGAPVRSYVVYLPGVTNSLADKVPEFATGDADRLHLPEFSTGPDGRYRLVGLPGRGVVAGWTVGKQYIPDAVASRITRMARDRDLVSLWRKPAGMNFLREIDAASNSPSQTCDFVVDAGGTIRISILDQAGKPVRPCICLYEMPGGGMMQWGTNDSPCDLRGFLPGESRTLLFLAGQRQVGKAVVAHYDPKAANTLSVALEPCATVKGRLIDEEGIPIKRQEVGSIARGGGDLWLPVGLATSKSDGRFVLHNLVPGAEFYTISAHGFGNVAEKVVVAAGKTIDLGEIRLKREK